MISRTNKSITIIVLAIIAVSLLGVVTYYTLKFFSPGTSSLTSQQPDTGASSSQHTDRTEEAERKNDEANTALADNDFEKAAQLFGELIDLYNSLDDPEKAEQAKDMKVLAEGEAVRISAAPTQGVETIEPEQ